MAEPANDEESLPEPPVLREATRAPWWRYNGLGLKWSLDDVTLLELLALIAVGLTIWGYVDIRNRGRVDGNHPEYHRTDFTVFTTAGAAFFDGREPYEVRNPRGWYYLYPPMFALMVSPLDAFDGSTQVCVWLAISAVAGFGSAWELARIWRFLGLGSAPGTARMEQLGFRVAFVAALAVLLPTLECLQRGQLGVVLLYALLLGYRLFLEATTSRQAIVAGVVLAWPVVVKLVPALPVGCLLLMAWAEGIGVGRRMARRRADAVTGGFVIGLVLFLWVFPSALVGHAANVRHLTTWFHKVASNGDVGQQHGFNIDSLTNQSLSNASYLLSAQLRGTKVDRAKFGYWLQADTEIARRRERDHVTRRLLFVLKTALVVLLVAVMVRVGRSGRTQGQALAYALAGLATIAVSPIAWTHYYVAWLPALILLPGILAAQGRIGLATAALWGPVVIVWAQYCATIWAGQLGVLGIGATLWLVAASVWLLRDPLWLLATPELYRRTRRNPHAQRETVVPSAAER